MGLCLCDTKESDDGLSDDGLPACEIAPLCFDLLESEIIALFVEVDKGWSVPLLIFLRVFVLQLADVLSQFLQNILFELAFGVTGARSRRSPRSNIGFLGGRRAEVKLPPLGRQ